MNPAASRCTRTFLSSWLWVLPVVIIAILAWSLRWMSDDGWINIRVVEQMLAGNGPVYNVGQRVEVGTSTLWLWLLIAASALVPWAEPSELAMVLGTVLMAWAFVLASWGSMHLLAPRGSAAAAYAPAARPVMWVPAGTAVLVALPPLWDFATSGLEMSLAVCWLAACMCGLARRLAAGDDEARRDARGDDGARRGARGDDGARPASRPAWLPVLIGLGPLVRPDFALFTLAFAVALLAQSRRSWRSWLGAALLAVIIPGTYQVFRMGYYGALVPNTALAKGASSSRWAVGLQYLVDFVQPYAVWLPVGLLVAVQIGCLRRWAGDRDWPRFVLVVALLTAGLLHGLYFVRVGGDFMHARFLLPATVALVLPVAVYPLRVAVVPLRATSDAVAPLRAAIDRVAVVILTALLVWSAVVATGPRTRYETFDWVGERSGRPPQPGLANERAWWVSGTNSHRTVGVEEWIWSPASSAQDALLARWDAERGRSYYQEDLPEDEDEPGITDHLLTGNGLVAPVRPGVFLAVVNIGATGNLSGPGVHVVDRIGLSDAVSARVRYDPAIATPQRIGHEEKPATWRLAQYAAPSPGESKELAAARRTLGCHPVRTLIRATTAPLTPRQFLSNVRRAPQNTFLAIPASPVAAERKLCP